MEDGPINLQHPEKVRGSLLVRDGKEPCLVRVRTISMKQNFMVEKGQTGHLGQIVLTFYFIIPNGERFLGQTIPCKYYMNILKFPDK